MERLSQSAIQDERKVLDEFYRDCQLRGMTEESRRRYRSSLMTFFGFLEKRGVQPTQINMDTLKEFLEHLRYEKSSKQKTLENNFSALSSFYDYLTFQGVISSNVILPFRRRYLKRYKEGGSGSERKLLTVEEMSMLVSSILDPRDKAISILLAKTGIRRGELLRIDIGDINWTDYSIILKPAPKRSNRRVFFDDEAGLIVRRWLRLRERLNPKTESLFLSYESVGRLDRNSVYVAITKHAKRLGLHDPTSKMMGDHFSPHCFRHWFTTWLMRNGMPREYVQELRGDRRREAIDIYHHIDAEDLRRSYLACIPKLGL